MLLLENYRFWCEIFIHSKPDFVRKKCLSKSAVSFSASKHNIFIAVCCFSALWTLLQTWLDEFAEDFRDPPMHSSLRLMCLQLRRHNSLSALAKCYEDLLKKFQAEGQTYDATLFTWTL